MSQARGDQTGRVDEVETSSSDRDPHETKLRVLGVVSLASRTGRYGGPFDTRLRQLAIASKAGFESHLVAGFLAGDVANPAPSSTELHFEEVRSIAGTPGFTGLISLRLLRTLVRQVRLADVVHVSLAREAIPLSALAISRLFRKRVVLQAHGMLTSRSSSVHRFIDVCVRTLVGRRATMIALTDIEAKALRVWEKWLKLNIIILGNPVPEPLGDQSTRVSNRDEAIFVARLHKRKRVDLFLSAALEAARRGWSDQYVVVGPDEGDLELVLQRESESANVVYEGALPSDAVTDRVSNARVFVLTSEAEPWGNVLALALKLGKPVVVSRSTALAGLIERFQAGRVFADGDFVEAANAIHELLTDEVEYNRAKIGANALSEATFSARAQLSTLADLYEGGASART
jgi:glycosyltransferase involved in cell wall biosynthesis